MALRPTLNNFLKVNVFLSRVENIHMLKFRPGTVETNSSSTIDPPIGVELAGAILYFSR